MVARIRYWSHLATGDPSISGTAISWKHFWTHQIPTSCLPTLLIFIHIEHTFCICPFLVAFFSATIDGLIFGHKCHIGTPYHGKRFLTGQIPTSCLPKSGGILSELMLTVHLVYNQFMMLDDYFSQMCVCVVTSNSNTIKIKLDGKLSSCNVSYSLTLIAL